MRNRLAILVALFFLLVAFIPGARAAEYEETIKKQFIVSGDVEVVVRNVNGAVNIETWDNPKVEILAYKSAHGNNFRKVRKYFNSIEINFEQSGKKIWVETHLPKRNGNGFFDWLLGDNVSGRVEYEIRLPAGVNLDVKTTNGKISVSGVKGLVKLKSTNGAIWGENISGMVEAKTTNGAIQISLKEVAPGEELGFYTTNGSIRLHLPEDLSCTLDAKTTNGSIYSDFEIRTLGKVKPNRLKGKIGSGDGLLDLRTVNGSIKLLKNS